MKLIGKITICLAFVFAFAGLVWAQDTKPLKGIIGRVHYAPSNNLKIYLREKYHKDFSKTFKQTGKIVPLVHARF